MKTIGLLGGLHSATLVLYSVDFAEIEALQSQGDWGAAGRVLSSAAQSLESAGAEGIVIATNTMHKVASHIENAVQIPLLHIADATARALQRKGIERVGLLGTRFTMEQAFYRERLESFGIEVMVPDDAQRTTIHEIIYTELCLGQVKEASRQAYLQVVDSLAERGCQGVILGCTEIGLLIGQGDTETPLFDTTELHAADAVAFALSGNE